MILGEKVVKRRVIRWERSRAIKVISMVVYGCRIPSHHIISEAS
jgi:hypothetical protein